MRAAVFRMELVLARRAVAESYPTRQMEIVNVAASAAWSGDEGAGLPPGEEAPHELLP